MASGKIAEFNIDTTDWEEYTEILECHFLANGTTDDAKKAATLLANCGAKTYKLIRNLVAPVKPSDKTYAELVKVVKDHVCPTPSITMMRFKFNSRVQNENESVATYIAELRSIAQQCDFIPEKMTLDEMLKDRLVVGVKNNDIQVKLLSEKDLTFKSAAALAQSLEAASINAKKIQAQDSADINKVEYKSMASHKPPPRYNRPLPRYNSAYSRPNHRPKPCWRCGKDNHLPDHCFKRNIICTSCSKSGHISAMCQNKPPRTNERRQKATAYTVEESQEDVDPPEDFEEYKLYRTTFTKHAPVFTDVKINAHEVAMEIDSGASLPLVSRETYNKLKLPGLERTNITLRTYTGEKVPLAGAIEVEVTHNNQTKILPLLVVEGNGPSLIGRNWLNNLRLEWDKIFQVNYLQKELLKSLLDSHSKLFENELGKLNGVQVEIQINEEAKPKFCKARSVPYAMKEKVNIELDRQVKLKEGILVPVQFSRWAAPVVPILKADSSIRICGDYKLTVNKGAKVDSYPLPRIDDLFTKLAGGVLFSKLDLSHAYNQLELDEASRELVTINTERGLLQPTRLPFGNSSSPALFQRTMENLLKDVPSTVVYLDDILVTGKTEKEHMANLEILLDKLESSGLKLKREKCVFMESEVTYLGHKIDKTGLHPTTEKIRAIRNCHTPTNVTELKSFLGLINYYAKFLKNLSMVLRPLYNLLSPKVRWNWTEDTEAAFQKAKMMLITDDVLVHYNQERDIVLACDASPYGIGAVISHHMADGSTRP